MSALRCLSSARTPTRAIAALRRTQPARYASEYGARQHLKPTPFGQPLFASHPHLMQPNETTPGIPLNEYERRRKALMESLPDGSIVVSVAGQVKYMSGQIFYKFRQSSDFWYLTGMEEPDAAVILEKNPSYERGYRMSIFSAGKDSHKEKWEGARTSFHDVVQHFKADHASHISDFADSLKLLSNQASQVYLDIPKNAMQKQDRPSYKAMLKRLSNSSKQSSTQQRYEKAIDDGIAMSKMRSLAPEIAKIRAIKSEPEQRIMRAAADISGHAHAKTMRFAQPDMSEHSIAAHFEYICAVNGAQRPAYVPVVASGPNALIIHYTSNNQIARQDEMILMDAGCEFNGYCSDITRTFPVSGTFTSPQAVLYNAVLQAQKYLITLCTESAGLSLAQIHRESVSALTNELNKIGFNLRGLSGIEDLERSLYPHYVGHPLGIDLHESSNFERSRTLKEGMVITIEPGIYVPPSPIFPKEFHNLGVRIEDEVLVGKDHPTVLSVAAPKEIADVEAACQGSLGLEAY